MRASRFAGVVAVVALMACSDEDWLYRARDAGVTNRDAGRMDVGGGDAGADGAVEDRGGTDAGPDGAGGDRGGVDGGLAGDDGTVSTSDVPAASDGGSETDAGTVAMGLTLRTSGITTMESGSATVGTLRLSETGFEMGERACVGPQCLVGGLVP